MSPRFLIAAACLLVAALGAVPLQAQVVWTGIGDDEIFSTNENWVGFVAPGPAATAQFGLYGNNYPVVRFLHPTTIGTIEFLANRDIAYSFSDYSDFATINLGDSVILQTATNPSFANVSFSNTLTLNLANNTTGNVISVGTGATLQINGIISGSGHFTKTGAGTLVLTAANTFNYLGGGPFVNSSQIQGGTVHLDGGAINHGTSGDVMVGYANGDNATLLVSNGGDVSGYFGVLGQQSGSTGSATISGVGSTWTTASGMGIGYGGTGQLIVQSGATVVTPVHANNSESYIGYHSTAVGTANVTGTGSSWTTADDLQIAHFGSGSLTIASGALVSNAQGLIGVGSTGDGSVTVNAGTWTNSAQLYVGYQGQGSLSVTNAGTVSSTFGDVGAVAGSFGFVDVTGTGSTWTNSSYLMLGNGGTASMLVSGGGAISDTVGTLGNIAGSHGEAVVTGTGSLWTNTEYLYVGAAGFGLLEIFAGGDVTSVSTSIGNNLGGEGSVTVDGVGSSLTNSGTLYVGSEGVGYFEVLNGATVVNVTGSVGNNALGDGGFAVVAGTGSSWTNTGSLIVGNATDGSVEANTGGAVSAGNATLGALAGSDGVLTVNDSGSSFTTTGNLVIGGNGIGELNMWDAGITTTGGQAIIANNAGSTGNAFLDGAGTQWNITGGDLYVGNAGTGYLRLLDQSSVSVLGGSGTIHLGHSGGAGELNIGYDGEGTTIGGIINAAAITSGPGTGTLLLGTTSSAGSPYYLTKDGTNAGAPVLVGGATSVEVEHGYNVFTGANSYTGTTSIFLGGTLAVTSLANGGVASGLGASTSGAANLGIYGTLAYLGTDASTDRLFTIGGPNPTLNGSGTGPIQFINTGNIAFSGSNFPLTLSLTGSTLFNSLRPILTDNGTGIVSLNVSGGGLWFINGANTYTGPTTITGATLATGSLDFGNGIFANGGVASGLGASSSAAANLVLNGGTLVIEGPAASSDRLFTIGVGGATLSDIGPAYTTGAITFSNPGAIALSGTDTARTLTLAGTSGQLFTLNPTLGDNGTGATSLLKSGTGLWRLNGANTYTGGTTVTGGTLVMGHNSALGTGALTLNGGALSVASGITFGNALNIGLSGGRIGGSGSFSSPLTLGAGVKIAPGSSPGTVNFAGGLTLNDGGTLEIEIRAPTGTPGTDWDFVNVTGTFNLSGLTTGGYTLKAISLDLMDTPGQPVSGLIGPASWTIASASTGISGFEAADFVFDTSQFYGGGVFSLSQSGNNLLLNFTPVPEPSTYALMLAGLAVIARQLRRRKRLL